MTILNRFICILFCLFALHTPAKAEELQIGISIGYPPYYYQNNGELTGFCIELIDAIAKEIDVDVQYKVYPWKRLILNAQQGSIDAIMPLFKTSEREEYLTFNGLGLAPETNQFFTLVDSAISFEGKNLSDLTSYRIGVVEEYSYGESFDSFDFPQKDITRNDAHLVEMFMHNRFDIGVGNRYVVQYFAKLAGIEQTIRFLDPPITQEILYLGFVKKRNVSGVAEKFAHQLQLYKKTPSYDQLINKYGIIGNN